MQQSTTTTTTTTTTRKESVSRKKSTVRRESVARKKSTCSRKQSVGAQKKSSVVSYCARSFVSPQYAHVIKSVEKYIRKAHSEQKWNEIL